MWPSMTTEDILCFMKNWVFILLAFIPRLDIKQKYIDEKVNFWMKRSSYVPLNDLWGFISFSF